VDKSDTAIVDAILERYPDKTGRLINALNDIQEHYRYLQPRALEVLASRCGVPLEELQAMAGFFKNLSIDPVGHCILEVCDGTACHTRGAVRLAQAIADQLGIEPGGTTDDGLVTIRLVHCVGACSMAPVVVTEDEFYGRVAVGDISNIVARARQIGYANKEADDERDR
jgi:NADH-quinone oxidoreductase subunit E